MFYRKRIEDLERDIDKLCKVVGAEMQNHMIDMGPKPGHECDLSVFSTKEGREKTRIRISVDDAIKQIMRHLKLEAQYTEATPPVTELVKIK
jgi:hypothetical protein